MANFCGKCGKPLQDGETCSCSLGSEQDQVISSEVNEVKEETVEVNVQPVQTMGSQPIQGEQQAGVSGYMYGQSVQGQPVQGQPMQGQPMQGQPVQGQPVQGQPMQGQTVQGQSDNQTNQFSQQASQAAAVAGKYAKNIWQILLDIWKAPADNLKNFVNESNFINALILIGAEAVLMIIFSSLILKKLYSMIMGIFGGMSYYFQGEIKVPYLSTIFSTLIGTALGACIFAGVTMLIVKQIGKANKNFKEAICIAATKSAAFLPFIVVAIITSLFSLPLSVVAIVLGGILGYYYVHTALDDGSIQDENKRVYISFLIFAIYIIISLILMYLYNKL